MLLHGDAYHLSAHRQKTLILYMLLVLVGVAVVEMRVLDGAMQCGVLLHAHVVIGFTDLLFIKLRNTYSHFESHVSINTILAFVILT